MSGRGKNQAGGDLAVGSGTTPEVPEEKHFAPLEGVSDQRPPVSWWERRELLRGLRRAARLLRRNAISEAHYGVLVLFASQRLAGNVAQGERLKGREFGTFSCFTEELWDLVLKKSGDDLEKSLSKFGPWNMAGVWAAEALRQPTGNLRDLLRFEWDQQADDLLEETRLRLKRWPRLKFAYEERLERNRKYFPHTTEVLSKVGFAVFGAVVGTLVTLLVMALGLR